MIERGDFFDSNFLSRRLVQGGAVVHVRSASHTHYGEDLPNNAVRAFADDILDVVLIRHIEGNLA
jgi:hypothetical protein